mmetsp:Transcript_42667/g.123992  ORF Transcript_42667/g.123992 Transcript_42667/m.123992 type:complete len:95 (+) Transcript_42667:208-492(+)
MSSGVSRVHEHKTRRIVPHMRLCCGIMLNGCVWFGHIGCCCWYSFYSAINIVGDWLWSVIMRVVKRSLATLATAIAIIMHGLSTTSELKYWYIV